MMIESSAVRNCRLAEQTIEKKAEQRGHPALSTERNKRKQKQSKINKARQAKRKQDKKESKTGGLSWVFHKTEDFEAFERMMFEALVRRTRPMAVWQSVAVGARKEGGNVAVGSVAKHSAPNWIDFVAAPLTDKKTAGNATIDFQSRAL